MLCPWHPVPCPYPFGVFPFAPLCARFATIDELSAHCCFALEERVRIGKVNSERSATNIDVIEVSDSGQSGFVVYRLMQFGKWDGWKKGKMRTCEFAEAITPRFSGLPIEYKPCRE
jgi:hypothetical protein